ncbi:hypothetical protein RB195_020616 [Necator americanus]|uniref:Uncharacterized protein n=1 Tax=Necator americanus TaxID=51031 RepID=A0ABR1CLD5_NECAM
MQILYLLWIPAVVNAGLAQTEDVNVVTVADADSSPTPAGETTEKPEVRTLNVPAINPSYPKMSRSCYDGDNGLVNNM